MTTFSKILLTITVAGLGGGSVIDYRGVGGTPALAAVLPLGAVSFGLFLIVFMLEKEVAKYDQEQAAKQPPAPPQRGPGPGAQTAGLQLKEKNP